MASEMHLQLLAILLGRGQVLDRASSVLTLLGLLLALAPLLGLPLMPLASSVAIMILILGIFEKYWAQRVAIDAELFDVLATKAENFNHAVSELDTALSELGLAPAVTTSHSLTERSRGALRLLRWQAISLTGQCILMIALCVAAPWLLL